MGAQRIGRYEIKDLLGRGGMASVYRGYDPHFERDVAVKVLPREFLHDPNFRARFEREAKTIGALEHPAIVPVHDFGEEDGQPYLVMRLMGGGSLADRIDKGPLSLADTARIVERIADALDAAHRVGIIHRDLKPSNILFDQRGNPYIADFGIVKVAEETAMLTGSGMVGTPAYMAPEMGSPGGLTPLVDVYALGVTVFQMLTARFPYQADTPAGIMVAHAVNPVPDPRIFRPDLPEDVTYVIERAMAKTPTERYQSAPELAADLSSLAASEGATAGDGALPSAARRAGASARTLHIPGAEVAPETRAAGAATRLETPEPRLETAKPPAVRGVYLAGIGVGVIVILAAVLYATGIIPLGPRPTDTPGPTTSSEPEQQTAEETGQQEAELLPIVGATEDASPTPVSLQPSIQILYGLSQAMPSGQTEFAAMAGNQPLNAGDTLRTGDSSAVLLTFGQGVSAEVHPSSELSLVKLVEVGGVLAVELSQMSGVSYHFIHRAEGSLPVEYSVQTPVAAVTATGTQFWVIQTAEGWCFLPTESGIEVDLGERDGDINDNYVARAGEGVGWLVAEDGTASPCQPDAERAPLTDGSILLALGGPSGDPTEEPTATRPPVAEGGGTTGGTPESTTEPVECGNSVCEPGENSDTCSSDCRCIDNGTCEAGEGGSCRDCSASAGTCGAPCTTSAQCASGYACSGGVCWNASLCGGGGASEVPTPAPGCGTCGAGGSIQYVKRGDHCYSSLCPSSCETWTRYYDACGVTCNEEFAHC